MKRTKPALLLGVFALTACGTMHDAAVSTFRVVDAPHQYVRRQLGVDDDGQQTTTTTTTETGVYSDTGAYPPSQPYVAQQPPPPPPPTTTQRRVVTSERRLEPPPTATPRVVQERETETTVTESTPEPQSNSSSGGELPYAKPVPGKAGYVFSPYDKNGGYVDVTGYSPGQKVKDPYSGKIFLVP